MIIAIMIWALSKNYLSSNILLITESIAYIGMLKEETVNGLVPFILFTAQSVSKFLNQDSSTALDFAKEFAVSFCGVLTGKKFFELLTESVQTINDKEFCRKAPCTILWKNGVRSNIETKFQC